MNERPMTPEERDVIQAAREYYWHNDESVELHNNLMGAVAALLERPSVWASTPDRPDVRPIHRAADRAMQDELKRWTYDVPEELRLALSRAVVKTLQQASMLNYDRPWELDDQFADVLAQADEDPHG